MAKLLFFFLNVAEHRIRRGAKAEKKVGCAGHFISKYLKKNSQTRRRPDFFRLRSVTAAAPLTVFLLSQGHRPGMGWIEADRSIRMNMQVHVCV